MSEFKPTNQPLEWSEADEANDSDTLWFSVSETAKLSGVSTKTIRRAIQNNTIRYKLQRERYLIDYGSIISYAKQDTKFKNKLNKEGIGRFVKDWPL